MVRVKFIFLLLFLTANVLLARGQTASWFYSLPTFDDSIPVEEIIRQTETLPSSTRKVQQLLAIAKIYRDHGRGKCLDTSLIYIREAHGIAQEIHDTSGVNEALGRICEVYSFKGEFTSAAALLPMAYGEQRIHMLLRIAEGYVNRQPVDARFLERAWPYLSKATQLADSIRSVMWKKECLMLQAKYFFEHGDLEDGKNAILTNIKICESLGDKKGVGKYWSEMSYYMPITSQTISYHLFACRESIRAYKEAGDRHDELYSLRDLAVMHRYACEYDSSEEEFMIFLRETAKEGTKPSANTNYELASLFLNEGHVNKALDYCLRSLNATGRKNNYFRRYPYGGLAHIYQQTGVPSEELYYGRLAVEEAIRFEIPELHYFVTFVVDALVKQNQPEKALTYLQEFNAAHPALFPEQQESLAYSYGLVYDALGLYGKADTWFRQLTNLDSAVQKERNTVIFRRPQLNPFLIHLYTGRFYVHWGKYQQAQFFLQKALTDAPIDKQSTAGSELHLMLYKTDSATGDLRSALGHYMKYTAIRDSVFNVEKMQQFQALQVQYQAKEKEQSILLLRSEGERQRDQLSQASLTRKVQFGGIIVLLGLAAWMYYAYRTKQRNVHRLILQQGEINEKNLALEQLVGEKNDLLAEKNLLLQEVHHRVKNNLHTVMSLLESQSAYLNDQAARDVLQDSQNRIQTISLLHQKLYGSSNVTSLEMAPYIAELCAFLASSLGARERRITISQFIEPIMLDLSLGLPIGLMLNEAITNALKHAFPDNADQNAIRTGHIEVSMRRLPSGHVLLQICDDGVGMLTESGSDSYSLGMTLMKSIGQKLGGRFSIRSTGEGVRVMLEFRD
ncbi:MAG: sensor histidine kinase [Bacteroidetes bacterium]|nr:sensor histidine kinase [Bacteroidota bacterium]